MSYVNYYPNSNILHASLFGVMGTQLDMLMVSEDEQTAVSIWHEMESDIVRLELMMSRFNPEAELYIVNRDAKKGAVAPSDELWSILSSCIEHTRQTYGYFDPFLGHSSDVEIDLKDHTVAFTSEDVYIDLGGYGKGYALSVIRDIARRRGVEDLFVSFGGSSILAMGHHPSSTCWAVSTSDPYRGCAVDRFELRDMSLTVSGNSPSNPSHIYDPHREAYSSERRMVAIVSRDPLVGEVLSTAGMLMPSGKFKRVTEFYNIEESKIVEL